MVSWDMGSLNTDGPSDKILVRETTTAELSFQVIQIVKSRPHFRCNERLYWIDLLHKACSHVRTAFYDSSIFYV